MFKSSIHCLRGPNAIGGEIWSVFLNGHVIYNHGFRDSFIFRNVHLFNCFSVKIFASRSFHSVKKQRMKMSKGERVEYEGLLRSALLWEIF